MLQELKCVSINSELKHNIVHLRDVKQLTIKSSSGLQAVLTNFGATVMSIRVPDAKGIPAEVTLGYDNIDAYIADQHHMGCIAGRVANRIRKGKFILDDLKYRLTRNIGKHHLHGGAEGWGRKIWTIEGTTDTQVRLHYVSVAGEEGYPGNVDAQVTYTVGDDNTLHVEIAATTDAPTIINPTSHCYFNLNDEPGSTILNHELTIHADHYLPLTKKLLPSGEIAAVAETLMEFKEPRRIGVLQEVFFDQIWLANGYDHTYALHGSDNTVRKCATLRSPVTGMQLEVSTNQPGLHLYSGNLLTDVVGRGNVRYPQYGGVCLEAQGFPDAINHENFPSVVLRPGEQFLHKTEYRFV